MQIVHPSLHTNCHHEIKSNGKIKIYRDYIKNFKLQIAINDASEVIDKKKNDYNCHLSSKLDNPKTSAKTYWSILKTFYSRKTISLIPPLLHNNTLITDIFNTSFAPQCTTCTNNSVIRDIQSHKANSRLSSLSFENDDIL